MNGEILIYSEVQNTRTSYVFSYLFSDLLGLHARFSSVLEEALAYEGPAVFYTRENITGKLCVRPSGLLEETGLKSRPVETGVWDGMPVIFADDPGLQVPFDIFSASFWLMSRYEEYLGYTADAYGRFPASESLAFRNGFLDLPVINLWTSKFAEVLRDYYPALKVKKSKFNWITTIDVDHAWAFRNKSMARTWGGLLRSFIKGNDYRKRISVLRGEEEDPYFCFDAIRQMHGDIPGKLIFFILSGKPGNNDLNVSPGNSEWQELVSGLAREYTLGLHPSFRSNRDFRFLEEEFETLSGLLPYPLKNSRQHFLKLKLPETYRNLATLGIENDYSMGFPGQTGFRAGLCTPFYFYDLIKENKTGLKVWPVTLMDRTLKDYLGKVPEETSEIISRYVSIIENAGGWFIPVWHNESLSDYGEWEGWKNSYIQMLEILKSKS